MVDEWCCFETTTMPNQLNQSRTKRFNSVSGKVLVRISVSLRSHSSSLAGSISRLVLPAIHSTKERQQQQHKKLQTQRPHSKRTTNNQESLFNLLLVLVEHHHDHEHHGDTNKTARTEEQEREQRDEQATESSSSSSEDEKENRQRSSSRERLRMPACWSVLEADTSSGRARGSCERMERKQYREREARFFVACCTTKRASASVSVSVSLSLSLSVSLSL